VSDRTIPVAAEHASGRHFSDTENGRLPPTRYTTASIGLGVLGLLAAAACGSASSTTTPTADQTLHFAVFNAVDTLDPAVTDLEVDSEIAQNVFDGPFRYDNELNVVPDIATVVPTDANGGVTNNDMTYTIHLGHDVTFSNGDKVTSKDVLYSWNRAAALNGPNSGSIFGLVNGFAAVQTAAAATPPAGKTMQQNIEDQLAAGNTAFEMPGLTAPDPYTVVINLAKPAGFFLSALALQSTSGMILDEKIIKKDPVNWWSKPSELIGTGAFKMTEYIPRQDIKFDDVPNWWGSPKPVLKHVSIDIKSSDTATQSTAIAAWEQGKYDLLGYGGSSSLPTADILRISKTSGESRQLHLILKGGTYWVSFMVNASYNPTTAAQDPFVGNSQAAIDLRMAFALSVDVHSLATTACDSLVCVPADGGLISKGLIGYGGAGTDPLAKYNPSQAKQLLATAEQLDPSLTSLVSNLTYTYTSNISAKRGLIDNTAQFLQGEWQKNLGIHVNIHNETSPSFVGNRVTGDYVMSSDGWHLDYNHPQDWYDNLWGAIPLSATANTSGYDSTTYDTTLTQADRLPLAQALPLYNQLAAELQKNAVYIPLYYSVGTFLIHAYVQGAGSTNQADYYWNQISLLSH
jgi:oligopeptide transport system substrate-binding protein